MNLKQMSIVIDVDEVIFDTYKQFYTCLIEKFGYDERYERLNNQWRMEDVLNADESAYLWGTEFGYKSEGFHRKIEFKEDAGEVITDLTNRCREVMIMTDTPKEIQRLRRQMLYEKIPDIPVFYTGHDQSQATGTKTKAELVDFLMDENDHVIVIDDAPHHIEEYLKLPVVEKIIVFDMPYNQHIEHEKIARVQNWKGVQELLNILT